MASGSRDKSPISLNSTAAVWSISEKEKPDRASVDRLGNEFLIGNGFVGLRGALDEYGPAEKVACIPTGIYDQRPGKWREPVSLPAGGIVEIKVKPEETDMPHSVSSLWVFRVTMDRPSGVDADAFWLRRAGCGP